MDLNPSPGKGIKSGVPGVVCTPAWPSWAEGGLQSTQSGEEQLQHCLPHPTALRTGQQQPRPKPGRQSQTEACTPLCPLCPSPLASHGILPSAGEAAVRKIRDRLQKTNPELKKTAAAHGKAPVLRAASHPAGGQPPPERATCPNQRQAQSEGSK